MKKKRYFNNNNDYFKFINKYKNTIDVLQVYYTRTKICLIYNID